MNAETPPTSPPPPANTAREVAALFLRPGLTAFGGPAAPPDAATIAHD